MIRPPSGGPARWSVTRLLRLAGDRDGDCACARPRARHSAPTCSAAQLAQSARPGDRAENAQVDGGHRRAHDPEGARTRTARGRREPDKTDSDSRSRCRAGATGTIDDDSVAPITMFVRPGSVAAGVERFHSWLKRNGPGRAIGRFASTILRPHASGCSHHAGSPAVGCRPLG